MNYTTKLLNGPRGKQTLLCTDGANGLEHVLLEGDKRKEIELAFLRAIYTTGGIGKLSQKGKL